MRIKIFLIAFIVTLILFSVGEAEAGSIVDVFTSVVTKVIGGALGGGSISIFGFSFNPLSFVVSLALSAVASALAPKPKMPSFNASGFNATAARDRIHSFREPVTTRKLVYGDIKVGGPVVFLSVTDDGGTTNGFFHMITVHATHEIQSFEAFYVNGNEITTDQLPDAVTGGIVNDGDYKDKVRIRPHLGTEGQAADSELVEEVEEWETTSTLSGMAYVYWRFKFDNDLFQGLPNCAVRVKGKKIFDFRTGTTAFSANPVLVLRDYLTDQFGMGVQTAEIDTTSFTAAANICDEDIALAAGETEKRYECHGMLDTEVTFKANIEDVLSSMHGGLIYSNGKFKCNAGASRTAVLTLDENDFTGKIEISPRRSRKDNFNAVKGKYISPKNHYQNSDYPPLTSTTFQTEDNGERIFRDLTLPMTTSPSMAQRLAKIALYTARQPLNFSATFSLAAMPLDVQDIVKINFDRYGWSGKEFEVLKWELVVSGDILGVQLHLHEHASTAYDWTASEETLVNDAPNTNLPSFITITSPTNLTFSEALVTTRDGRGVQSLGTVEFTAATDAFVTHYEMEYKLTTASDYIAGGRSSATKFEIVDMAAGTYDVRARSISTLGNASDFISITATVAGLAAAPSAMTNLSINQIGGMAFLQWTQSTDLDVRMGGHVEIRFQNITGSSEWMKSTLVDDSIAGVATSAVVPMAVGTYLLKFVDSTGNKQTNATSVVTTGATILAYSTASTVTESTAFAGTKTNLFVDSSNALQLTSSGLLDAVTDFDAITDFNFLGTINTSGTYEFATNMDLSTVKNVRLQRQLTVQIINALDQFDSRAGNVDTWADFDGNEGAAVANIKLYYASTDDNPAGSPTWSAYKEFTSVEERARAYKFKAVFSTTDSAYNIKCTAMAVQASTI